MNDRDNRGNRGNTVKGGKLNRATRVSTADTPTLTLIATDHLLDNPYLRWSLPQGQELESLVDVIRQQGHTESLTARPHPTEAGYCQLAWGHRRRDAARLAGITHIPTIIVRISDYDMVAALVADEIQHDMAPYEAAKMYKMMHDEMHLTHEVITKLTGKGLGYVKNRYRISKAPEDVQELVRDKPNSLRMVAILKQIPELEIRTELISLIRAGAITTDDISIYRDAMRSARRSTKSSAERDAMRTEQRGAQQVTLNASDDQGGGSPDVSPDVSQDVAVPESVLAIGSNVGRRVAQLQRVQNSLRKYRSESLSHYVMSVQERDLLHSIRDLAASVAAQYDQRLREDDAGS